MVHKRAAGSASHSALLDVSLSCSAVLLLALAGPPAQAHSQMVGLIGAADSELRPPLLIQIQGSGADFKAENAAGLAGRPIPLKIEPLGPVDKTSNQLFIFTGLPEGVKLSPGGDFGDFWAVNANVIKDLTLTAPPNFAGSFTLWVTRSRDQGSSARSVAITVTVGAPASVPTAAAATATTVPEAPQQREATGSTRTRPGVAPNEKMLLARAQDSFGKGDVSGARAIYEYLALQGSSAAAMAMGESYDPLVLAKMVVKGLEADPKKAQQWYEKAEELGSREARSRLNALAAR
jgi:hypothetical protein